jgi:N-acetylmuramic acid 6-phosphate etherase
MEIERPMSKQHPADDWIGRSTTEQRNERTTTIDTLPTREVVAAITAEDMRVPVAVAAVGDAIAALADVVVERWHRGGRLIYVGAGTSGRLGVLDASEILPTFGVAPGRIIGLIAGGQPALTTPVEAVEDSPEQGAADLAALDVGPDDVVLGLAASGRTPYVIGAVRAASERGAYTAGLACTSPSALESEVDLMIAPVVGPEVVTGSTRMKAGTAQKLVLNTLSTTIMIRLGKTFGNLMVDVQPTNEKLRQRAIRIVVSATGISADDAKRLLAAADEEPKTAIVMALTGLDADLARTRLAAHGGHVRAAIEG